MVNGTADFREHFAVDKETNTLRVTAPLDFDCDGCRPWYDISIVSTNNQISAPAYYQDDSVLAVRVTVTDLNDNVPEFKGIESFYVYSTQEDECKDCRIVAEDKDTGRMYLLFINYSNQNILALDKTLVFTITDTTSNDPSIINATSDPFTLAPQDDGHTVELVKSPSYNPDPEQQVYFDINLEVADKAEHKASATVKIVVMTGINNVTFGFDNTGPQIREQLDDIKIILESHFNWSFSSRGVKENVDFRAEGNFTTLEGYFVDPNDEFKPKDQLEIATRYDEIFDELWMDLYYNLNLSLDGTEGFRGATTDNWQNPDTRAFIIVGSVTGGLLVVTGLFLLTAYILRTRDLQRKVKVYETSAGDNNTDTANGGVGGMKVQTNHLGPPGTMEIPGIMT